MLLVFHIGRMSNNLSGSIPNQDVDYCPSYGYANYGCPQSVGGYQYNSMVYPNLETNYQQWYVPSDYNNIGYQGQGSQWNFGNNANHSFDNSSFYTMTNHSTMQRYDPQFSSMAGLNLATGDSAFHTMTNYSAIQGFDSHFNPMTNPNLATDNSVIHTMTNYSAIQGYNPHFNSLPGPNLTTASQQSYVGSEYEVYPYWFRDHSGNVNTWAGLPSNNQFESMSGHSSYDNSESREPNANPHQHLVNLDEHQNSNLGCQPETTCEDQAVSEYHNSAETCPTQLTISPKNDVGCDNTKMTVQTSGNRSKKLCCPFCDKLVVKLARHMEAVHKQEADVQKFVSLPKESKERHQIQAGLKNVGILNWNKNAVLNKNILLTNRRPNARMNKKSTDYKACPYCFGSYAKTALRHHLAKYCKKKPLSDNDATKGERITMELATLVEGRLHPAASQKLKELFATFRENEIVHLIRFDWLIIVYGNKLCVKYTKRTESQKNMKSYRLKMAGRILQSLKSIDPEVNDFESIYHPKYYDSLIEAIKTLAKFNDQTAEFSTPACASIAVTVVRHIGKLLIAEYIKRDQADEQRRAENFLKLLDTDASTTIGKAVTETQARMRREKKVILPSTEDVKCLSLYVDSQRNSWYDRLASSFTYKNWLELAKYTMVSIMIYNRRRTGDTQYIGVADFKNREFMNDNSNKELFAALSEDAKKQAMQFSRLKTRGKKGRTVNVLLKAHYEECIKLLLAHRKEAGVSTENEFLFGLPTMHVNTVRVVNACNTIRKCANDSGAKEPSTLTGTNLRKHFATVCASLELSDSKVSDVADFMGHAEKVHREYYRQNQIDREVVQMSRLLEVAQGNYNSDDSDTDQDDEASDIEIEPCDVSPKNSKKKILRKRKGNNRQISSNGSKKTGEEKQMRTKNHRQVATDKKISANKCKSTMKASGTVATPTTVCKRTARKRNMRK